MNSVVKNRLIQLHKVVLVVMSILTGIAFTIVAIFLLSMFLKDYLNRTEFDQQVWVYWQETESTMFVRVDMVHHLMDEYELIGLSEEEIIELLGKPDSKYHNSISYYLGPSRSMGMQYGTLKFKLKNGVVVEHYLHFG